MGSAEATRRQGRFCILLEGDMTITKFDTETLKKLRAGSESREKQPENGATTPSSERLREAVTEANDLKRLITLKPGYYCPSN